MPEMSLKSGTWAIVQVVLLFTQLTILLCTCPKLTKTRLLITFEPNACSGITASPTVSPLQYFAFVGRNLRMLSLGGHMYSMNISAGLRPLRASGASMNSGKKIRNISTTHGHSVDDQHSSVTCSTTNDSNINHPHVLSAA